MELKIYQLLPAAGLLFLSCFALPVLQADDLAATREYEVGLKLYNQKEYHDAVSHFADAELLADSTSIKANSTLAQIACHRMCEMPYQEFTAIQKLLDRFPEYADFKVQIDRLYELGTLYYQGKREPAFYAMRWIPWLHDSDKSAEILQAAVHRAPFAQQAPSSRLRIAYLLDSEGRIKESLKELRTIIKDYPETTEARVALLALASGLHELAKRGDGDGSYAAETEELLKKFEKRYPNSTELNWCRIKMRETRDARAQRLLDVAQFYRRAGRTEASERYLAEVLRDYPDTLAAEPSEKLLVKLDNTFIPMTEISAQGARIPAYRTYPLPKESTQVLLAPGENGNHFLRPVPDLTPEPLPPQSSPKGAKK